jgi:1-acyl-sn-glycerol-3-phosphate acyltransferase
VLRGLLALSLIALDTIVLGGPALLLGLVDRSGRGAHRIAQHWARLLLRVCGVRVVVSGAENIPTGPALYAANHCSALDIPILFGHLPVSFRIIYKRSLSLIPFLGWYLVLGGHIAIDRGNPFKAKRSLAAAAARIRGGTSVAVFPEGTRSPDASVRHFKRGSFQLALNAGVPVVPVSLVGVKRLVPKGVRSLRQGTVELRVHPPIATDRRSADEAATLAEEVRRIVEQGCVGT